MSEYTLVWRRYGLEDNPYFTQPLTVGGRIDPKKAFIGREEEKEKLKKVLKGVGPSRYPVIGDAGVGKTSLVNFVRQEAKETGKFFTPANPIEITRKFTGEEVILLTLSSMYETAKIRDLDIPDSLREDLDDIMDVAADIETRTEEAGLASARQKINSLFARLSEEILEHHRGIILHYDNLDTLTDSEDILDILNEIRDFLMTDKLYTFFVGDIKLARAVRKKKRVEQIFETPALRLDPFQKSDVKKILEKRYELMRLDDARFQKPHTEEVVDLLYGVHDGNLRSILKALSTAVGQMPETNSPIQLTEERACRALYQKAEKEYLDDLTVTKKEVLRKVLDEGRITPSNLADQLGKKRQNVSTYLKQLEEKGAVRKVDSEDLEYDKTDGRKTFYEVTPEVKWLKLQDKSSMDKPGSQKALEEFTSKFKETKDETRSN